MRFEGADVVRQPLRDIAELTYSAGFNGTGDERPYLRILIDENGDGFNFKTAVSRIWTIMSSRSFPRPSRPRVQSAPRPADQVRDHRGHLGLRRTARAALCWTALIAAHGDEPIFQILITAGRLSAGGTTDVFLNSLSYELAGSAPVKVSFSD